MEPPFKDFTPHKKWTPGKCSHPLLSPKGPGYHFSTGDAGTQPSPWVVTCAVTQEALCSPYTLGSMLGSNHLEVPVRV